jgi:hypothetical protein
MIFAANGDRERFAELRTTSPGTSSGTRAPRFVLATPRRAGPASGSGFFGPFRETAASVCSLVATTLLLQIVQATLTSARVRVHASTMAWIRPASRTIAIVSTEPIENPSNWSPGQTNPCGGDAGSTAGAVTCATAVLGKVYLSSFHSQAR